MNLTQRPAMIGTSINSRSEHHGEELIPAFDIPLSSVLLSREELGALLGDPLAWGRLFNQRADGLAEPAFKNLKPFALKDSFEHSSAALTVGLMLKKFTFEDCKLSKLKLAPQVGGLTALSVTLQCLVDDGNTTLLEYLGKECTADITFGSPVLETEVQHELPLSGDGLEAPAPKKRGRPRKSANHIGTPEEERERARREAETIEESIAEAGTDDAALGLA